MVRRWLRAGFCAIAMSAIGCGENSLGNLITNTNNQVKQVASSFDNIKNRLDDYVKKKEGGKDEDGAKRDLDDAVAEAKKLKELAKALQSLSTQTSAVTGLTEEKKDALREQFQSSIESARNEVDKAHRDMKKSLDEAKKKYESELGALVQALTESQGEFAAIVRRR